MTEEAPLKHRNIARTLAREIRTGRRKRGSRLPGEHALAARFSVSRNTIRSALTELSGEGLIATHSGKGSFVTFDGRAGLLADHGEEWVSAEPLNDTDAAELERRPGEWFLRARRVTWTAGGELVEHVDSLLDPLRFQLHLRFGNAS
jgi:DNA-binding GntR family transcriptional regulator